MKKIHNWLFMFMSIAISYACTQSSGYNSDIVDIDSGKLSTALSLQLVGESDIELVVDLIYRENSKIADDNERPRMMELFIEQTGVTFIKAEPLQSIIEVDKQLVVIDDDNSSELRTVIFSTANLNRLRSGGLVRYYFSKSDSDSLAKLTLINRRPIFAPIITDDGVTLDKPLIIGGEL